MHAWNMAMQPAVYFIKCLNLSSKEALEQNRSELNARDDAVKEMCRTVEELRVGD